MHILDPFHHLHGLKILGPVHAQSGTGMSPLVLCRTPWSFNKDISVWQFLAPRFTLTWICTRVFATKTGFHAGMSLQLCIANVRHLRRVSCWAFHFDRRIIDCIPLIEAATKQKEELWLSFTAPEGDLQGSSLRV